MDDKGVIRRRMQLVRDMVDDRLIRSVELWGRVAALPQFEAATNIMAFVGFGSEPDTDSLFARLAAQGKRLLLPRVQDGALVVADGSGPRVTSRFGVSEPQGPALALHMVEFVIVPGLAFTLAGDRLGYGQGYYDGFLAKVDAPNAGVCFAEQVVDVLPVSAHDVRVQRVITA
jgi:5-formyltetrahydrofolate cyclo-ligase